MAVVLGRNVIIYRGYSGDTKAIAAAKSCTVSKKGDLFEVASAVQQSAKEFDPGRSEWDVSLNHLVVSDGPFEGILMVNQKYTLRVVINGVTMKGTAICQQADLSAPVNGLASGTVKFKGSGELSQVVVNQ